MATIPTLTTSRLILRRMGMGDWESYRCFMASDCARHMGGPFTPAVAWGMFCADHAQWSLLGCGALMIEHQDSGDCLGQVGINHGPLFPERELGWLVYPEAEGHGFAFEAATALRDWARETRNFETLVSYIDPANLRSIRLAERLGATLDPQAARPDPGDLVYRHFGSFAEGTAAAR